MKISVTVAGFGMLGVFAGILMKDHSKLFALILIVIGIIVLFTVFLSNIMKHADKCPKCGTILYRSVRMYREKRDGLIQCPKCESLVRVEEIHRK